MAFLSIVHQYLFWHYSRAFLEIFHVWLNLLWYVVHVFSLPQLLRTWFSPWKRITENRGETWDLEDLAGFVIINIVSRIIGAIVRTCVIVLGLVVLFIVVLSGFLLYMFWVAAPFCIILLFGAGVSFLLAA